MLFEASNTINEINKQTHHFKYKIKAFEFEPNFWFQRNPKKNSLQCHKFVVSKFQNNKTDSNVKFEFGLKINLNEAKFQMIIKLLHHNDDELYSKSCLFSTSK